MPRRIVRALMIGLTATLTIGLTAVGTGIAQAKPTFKITTVATGRNIVWDLTWIGDLMIFDERGGGLWSKRGTAAPRRIKVTLPTAYKESEGGRLGLVADPNATSNGRFYLCQTYERNGDPVDVRVLRLRLLTATSAMLDGDDPVVVDDLPLSSGRHSGCRLRFGTDGKLYIGTGDAARWTNPQNRQSLGGKVLRVNWDGSIPTDNPYFGDGGNARYVWNLGHRNVQGLAVRPGTDEMWTAEHGTDRDDELNLNLRGANYGWDPDGDPGYDESTSMTDLTKFPGATKAKWSSGDPTVATSGITFLNSSAWGHWQGAVVAGMLAGEGIRVFFLDPAGNEIGETDITGLAKYHRIRTVQYGPDRALYFTTSNGGNRDVIGKITPTAKPPSVKPGTNVSSSGVSAVRTGPDLYAFIRSTDNKVLYKRSTNDGQSWPSSWTSTGLTSASAPAVASSGAGRVDLLTRTSGNSITHTWLVDGIQQGQRSLGGPMTTATISSVGDGSLDVLGLRTTGGVYRKHFDGASWSSWHKLAKGGFTSAVGAAADRSTAKTLLTVRGPTGRIYQRTITADSDGTAWSEASGQLWSARALGDRVVGQPLIAVSKGSDGFLRLQRDGLVMALSMRITSDPDVVTRSDGSWVVFGRSTSGALTSYDSRTLVEKSLGGTVR